MRKISVSQYIAANDPEGAKRIIAEYGLTANSLGDLSNKLKTVAIMAGGEKALMDALMIHPDRTMILSSVTNDELKQLTVNPHPSQYNFSNMAGYRNVTGCNSHIDGGGCKCGGKCGKSNIDGPSPDTTAPAAKMPNYFPAVLVSATALVLIALIFKN